VGKTGVDFLALQEQALTAFTTMLGSGAKAQAFFAQLQQFAATTPFELPGILQASQRLLAFGFQAKDIIPDLTAIGNAVAATGGGQANMDRIILALGQMKAKGKVQGDEMLQLTESNIAAWQYLADFLHRRPDRDEDGHEGARDGQQGIDAILAGLNKDPKFAGMMAAQSHTFTGLVSNMHDYWNMFAAAIMRPLFDRALKPGLQWLTTWLSGPGLALGTRLGTLLGDGLHAGRAGGRLAARAVPGVPRRAGGRARAGSAGTLAVGFLLIKDTITNRVLPALRLFWATFGAGVGKGVTFQGVVMGIVGVVERLGRWFQIGVDAVVTFRQALAGDWFNNGSANALVNTIGRIGLALRDIGRAFQAGGAGGALAQLWTGYLQPALTNAWASLTGWIGAQIPGLLTARSAPGVRRSGRGPGASGPRTSHPRSRNSGPTSRPR
jgi:tape measure domain-containing protein